jgi:hypothetical protein
MKERPMNTLASSRFDLYGPVHKGVRALMADTVLRFGSLDLDDERELQETCGQALDMLALLRSHVDHEDEHIHPLLERCRAGGAEQATQEHVRHRQVLETLAGEVRALLAFPSRAAADALYQNLAELMAENLHHMRLEDIEHQAVLWAHYSDAELAALDGRIVASIPPKELMMFLRWMLPAMSPPQRLGLMLGLRAQAPATVHMAVSRLAQQHLPAKAWTRLLRDIEQAESAPRAAG